jgi:hypothetical protein
MAAGLAARRSWVVALASAALLFGTWHYWTLFTSLQEARSEILAVRADMAQLDPKVSGADLARAQAHADRADRAVTRARAHFNRDPLLRGPGSCPSLGRRSGRRVTSLIWPD